MSKDDFDFLNSDIWLNYTQQNYRSPEEIRYRLQEKNKKPKDWESVARKIVAIRKTNAITLFIDSIAPRFWFYPADIILWKINEIDRIGTALYEKIRRATFEQEFLLNSRIEEAITSAIYEGAHSTRAQAKQLIASKETPKNKDEWMLINNLLAMNWVKDHNQETLSKDTILTLHEIVTRNTLEGDDVNYSGRFRDDTVSVGPHEGIQYDLIETAINQMIKLITQNRRYIHPIIRGVLIHYFIAYIHPFFDGNGRTARALFYFKSMKHNLKYVELLSVSAYLKQHGEQYEKAFQKVVENEYDVTYFIDFCLDSMLSALKQVEKKITYLIRMADLKQRFKLNDNQLGLLQRMALNKFRFVHIEEYAAQIKMSRETARQDLKELQDQGLLVEFKSGKKLCYKVNAEKLRELYKDPGV
ncbi:MAG: Fic family protein [Bdellovibrionaceae bacterium]|nr:Fic family protein [Pseudobdellovibrionaceae bacterium]